MNKNEKGFGIVQVLLLLTVVAIIGGTGYFVYKKNNNTGTIPKGTSKVAVIKANDTTSTVVVDPTKDWIAYTNTAAKFSLKYPSSWVVPANTKFCSAELFMVGGDAKSVGTCASENIGQMYVTSSLKTATSDSELKDTDYTDLKSKVVIANGVTGKRQAGTYKLTNEFGIGPEAGDKKVQYLFVSGGREYIAGYNIGVNYPDVLKDFDLMITKTLTFDK